MRLYESRILKKPYISSLHVQKMKFSIKNSFSKCDQIRSLLRIWSHLLKKSLMGNFIFCAVIEKMTRWLVKPCFHEVKKKH